MNGTKQLLWISAGVEAVTGIFAVAAPSVLVWLVWAVPLTVGGNLVARVAGIALICLAIACWPSRSFHNETSSVRALLAYNVLVAAFLIIIGIRTPFVGVLLWLVAVFHFVMSVLFVLAWRRARSAASPAST